MNTFDTLEEKTEINTDLNDVNNVEEIGIKNLFEALSTGKGFKKNQNRERFPKKNKIKTPRPGSILE